MLLHWTESHLCSQRRIEEHCLMLSCWYVLSIGYNLGGQMACGGLSSDVVTYWWVTSSAERTSCW